jgi:hypothetical protein
MALTEIGEDKYADAALRHQARIGDMRQHEQLLAIAGVLNLPETQLYLAHNTPQGRKPSAQARYPQPKWEPNGGWKVDPALVFAHTLQESRFQRTVVSPAGAYGLMQVRPRTAKDLARWRGESVNPADLRIPAVNMDFGQSYLQYLSKDSSTDGLLPKVIAAYNAGPAPVSSSASLSPDVSSSLLRLSEIVSMAMRTGLNGRAGSIGIGETGGTGVGQPYQVLAVGKARPFALREGGAADRRLALFGFVHPVIA